MPRKPSDPAAILDTLQRHLAALPGVFSTPQWGGRAYKVDVKPKAKLVAFVARDDDRVTVSFKLDRERAARLVDDLDWLEPHSFRTLGPAGWVTGFITRAAQAKAALPLLDEAHAAFKYEPVVQEEAPAPRGRSASEAARRIERVVKEAVDEGWDGPASDW